ncbi:MAG: F0F1 ATP synthase subunit delta [Candidatus Omnitrophota bacterium]
MALAQLVILQLLIFAGLIFLMRHMMTRNISKATGHLQDLTKDFETKEEAVNRRLEEARSESQDIVTGAKRTAEELKNKLLKSAHETRDAMLEETTTRCEQMVERAERACKMLRSDLDRKIDRQATAKACGLFREALPDELKRKLHDFWVADSFGEEFTLEHLNLPKEIGDVSVRSAYDLTEAQRMTLKDKLEKELKVKLEMREEADPALMAGFIITIGSVVIDASLANRFQKALIRNEQ